MYRMPKQNMNQIAPLFGEFPNTLILSCLQGYMGRAWVNDITNPLSAQIITGDFCYYVGIPDLSLVKNFPAEHPADFLLAIPPTEEWTGLIEMAYPGKCERFKRYAIKKEADIFNIKMLTDYLNLLPHRFTLKPIDETIFRLLIKMDQLRDLCSVFDGWEAYNKYGIGYVILDGNRIAAGASSYIVYDSGIEIEVDTLPEYRRQGLALVCTSRLILECLKRGLYPSWDAMNKESVSLAQKLGYHFDHEYVTYMIQRSSN